MAELRALGAKVADFRDAGARLVAVSNDSVPENQILVAKHGLGFPILSDPHMELIRKLGMVHEKANPIHGDAARPGTYVIDRDGRIRALFVAARIRTRPDPAEVLVAVRKLPTPDSQ